MGEPAPSCGGIYDDAQIEGLARVTALIKDMGGVAAIQLGHTGRKGSELKPWEGEQRSFHPTTPTAGRCAARRPSPMAGPPPIRCTN